MNGNILTIVIIVILVLAVLFLIGSCKLDCTSNIREGYIRSCLGGDCYGLQRTPVDYAFKYPHGWQRNPHYRTDPSVKYQPLDYGPVDLWADARKLGTGKIFKQYDNWWAGGGRNLVHLSNDEKNRFDLTNIGDYSGRQALDDMYSPRFGPKGWTNNESDYDEPNPYFSKIYGGTQWLTNDKIGDR